MRYWSDYSRVYYHPKSLVQLHEYELQSQLMPFEGWGVGDELFAGLDKEHDLLDRCVGPRRQLYTMPPRHSRLGERNAKLTWKQ